MEKIDYILLFRRAKTESSLTAMVLKALRDSKSNTDKNNIYLAECHRQTEIESGRLNTQWKRKK